MCDHVLLEIVATSRVGFHHPYPYIHTSIHTSNTVSTTATMDTQPPVPPASTSTPVPAPADPPTPPHKPVAIICIGMAGSVSAIHPSYVYIYLLSNPTLLLPPTHQGKTTLLQRLNSHLHTKQTPPYILNLDPAVTSLPYTANIDIRDTIDYKQVMESYNLGPNGGILTALNLFTTKFDQVLDILEKRSESVEWVVVFIPFCLTP
jgi:GPN-loop GTPase